VRRVLLVGALSALLLAPAAQAAAQSSSPAARRDPKVEALQAEVERLRAELAALREEMGKLREEAARAPVPDTAQGARLAEIEARQARAESELGRVAEELKRVADGLDAVTESDRKRPAVTLYGTLQAMKYEGENSLLNAEAFELVFSGRPHKRLGYFAEIEFERAAAVGGERGGEVVLEQAYASYTFASQIGLRAGVLLVPFGNVNVDHYAPMRDVVSKPLVSYVVAPSDWTENGVQLYGRQMLGTSWHLDYQATVAAGLDSHIDALGMRLARQPFGVDNNDDKALVGRLAASRGSHFELGLSGYTGKYDDADSRRLDGWAVDNRTEVGPLRLTGEYNSFAADRGPLPDARWRGYYVRASFDLVGGVLRKLAKDFDDPRLTLVAQYDWVKLEAPLEGAFVVNEETRVTWGLAYRPSRQWVLKLCREENSATNMPLVKGDRDGWLGSIGFIF
jgi:hypothetical protein